MGRTVGDGRSDRQRLTQVSCSSADKYSVNPSPAYAPVTDEYLLTQTARYMHGQCFLLAYELQKLTGWDVAITANEDDEGAVCHVFVINDSGVEVVALDIQGLSLAQDLVDQFMADDYVYVDVDELLSDWEQDLAEDGEELTDEDYEQAAKTAALLVGHMQADIEAS
jgi:hypothetical protein